ncbi:MAG TPA: protein kinase [Leptospiraceae bacterium]|nr:protein kinase [Leptospiraceae bacterium]HMW03684.1 protein kinase [Leptospiraceae bacterium]HMX35068.1 protein kinase [Leptospiraceae bacterium]HMY29395.1 protein kinase [Leptospiraceae bacterium]HMZ67658.1 protein kinase [Leptospiraceae bacterium]
MIDLYFDYQKKNVFKIPDSISLERNSYEISDRISNGGNAVVHKCFDSIGNEYAIKFFLKTEPVKKKRFLQEIEVMEKIDHHHIVKVLDSGIVSVQNKQVSEAPCIVMELADSNLQMLKNQKEIPYFDYIEQFRGLSSALAELHKLGIHRDIKPDNILIFGDRWVLSDFGLFKYNEPNNLNLTNTDEIPNPKTWLSPEGINSYYSTDSISHASDVFQMGCIFWYVVNGKYPLGVVEKDDWKGKESLFEFMIKTLFHNVKKRISNGTEMLQYLEDSLIA